MPKRMAFFFSEKGFLKPFEGVFAGGHADKILTPWIGIHDP